MAQPESKERTFLKRHKLALQTVALILILVLPFLLYLAAQGGHTTIGVGLLALMAIVMMGIVVIR